MWIHLVQRTYNESHLNIVLQRPCTELHIEIATLPFSPFLLPRSMRTMVRGRVCNCHSWNVTNSCKDYLLQSYMCSIASVSVFTWNGSFIIPWSSFVNGMLPSKISTLVKLTQTVGLPLDLLQYFSLKQINESTSSCSWSNPWIPQPKFAISPQVHYLCLP